MTLAVAWISGRDVFVVADSIVTTTGDRELTSEVTSVGEEPPNDAQERTSETVVKVTRVGADAIATLAGDARAGVEALRAFEMRLVAGASLEEALEYVRTHHMGDFTLVVAGPGGDGTLNVYCVQDERVTVRYEDHHVTILGSAGPAHSEFVRQTIESMSQASMSPDELLVKVVVALQAQGVRNNQLQRGIGGAFSGLRSGAFGRFGQDDILYLFLETNGQRGVFHRALHVGWRGELAFTRAVFRSGKDWEVGPFRVIAMGVKTASEDDARRAVAELTGSESRPRYIAIVDVATSAVVLLEQSEFVERNFAVATIGTAVNVSLRPLLLHMLGFLPSLEDAHRHTRVAFWLVRNVADVQDLERGGAWTPPPELPLI